MPNLLSLSHKTAFDWETATQMAKQCGGNAIKHTLKQKWLEFVHNTPFHLIILFVLDFDHTRKMRKNRKKKICQAIFYLFTINDSLKLFIGAKYYYIQASDS